MVRAAQAAMSDMDMDTLKQMAGMAGMMTKGRGDRVFDINPTPAPMPSSQSPGGRVESRTGSNSGVPEAGSMVSLPLGIADGSREFSPMSGQLESMNRSNCC